MSAFLLVYYDEIDAESPPNGVLVDDNSVWLIDDNGTYLFAEGI